MELYSHNIASLFGQLGLDNSDEAIDLFIHSHKPLNQHKAIYEADFWSAAQSEFIKQALADDADWAIVVDQLDVMLR